MSNFFIRDNLIKPIHDAIENSIYELPLKKSEIETIIKQAKTYVQEHINFDANDYDYHNDNYTKRYSQALDQGNLNLLFKEKKEKEEKSIKAQIISTILDDFDSCSSKTQELIALGLVGLIGTEDKYVKMYYHQKWEEEPSEEKPETFGWEDGIYLSTGDDWDWNPDKEREQEESLYEMEDFDEESYELNEDILDHYLNEELSKYCDIHSKQCYFDEDNYRYKMNFSWWELKPNNKKEEFKSKQESFNELSYLIEKEFSSIDRIHYKSLKELKHNKMLISLYKKLQKEIYKQELRELIRADIYFCSDYTVDIVRYVTYFDSYDIFELDYKNFYDVLKMLQDEFDLYLKEKQLYESNKSKNK